MKAAIRNLWKKSPLVQFLVALSKEFFDKECQKSAAALTYMTLFALVPIMTVTYSMFSLVPAFDGVAERLQNLVFENFVPETSQEVQDYLSSFSEQARSLTIFGVIMLVVTAYFMLTSIEKTFNLIWGVKTARRGLTGFLLYWAVLSIGPLLLGVVVIVSTYLMSLRFFFDDVASISFISPIFRLVPLFATTLAFSLLFIAVPNCRVGIKQAFVGGFVAAICFEGAKLIFTSIVANSSFKLIYGAFAAVPLFLLWINIFWTIVLGGALLVRNLSEPSEHIRGPNHISLSSLMTCLDVFFRKSLKGEAVSDKDCLEVGITPALWRKLREKLIENQLVARVEGNFYVLQQDLSQVSVWDLIEMFKLRIVDLNVVTGNLNDNNWESLLEEIQTKMKKELKHEFSPKVSDVFLNQPIVIK